jgi:tetratricopeptide (TPR) repeat protein
MNQEEAKAVKTDFAQDLAVRIMEECPDPEERADQLFRYAIQLAERGELTGAQAVLGQLESGPKASLSPLYTDFVRAVLKEAHGDVAGALKALLKVERAIAGALGTTARTVEFATDLCTRIGMLSLELREPRTALESLTKVPETPFVSYLIGTCYFDLTQYEIAIDYLARSLYSAIDDRTRLLASYQLGVAEYRRGRYNEALRHLSRCTTLLGCGSLPSGLIYEAIVASANRAGDYEMAAQYTPLLAMHVTGFSSAPSTGPGQS